MTVDNKTILLIAGAVGLFLFMRSRKAKGAATIPTTTAGSWLMVDGKCFDMKTDAPIDCPAEALGG
jgi:hypothetical protein